ncbi:MAG: hypothetical protein IJ165_11420 [Proteobacteria bacterium]|nr:hypothetical protein [Pseudomonadota bacterium]
MQCPRLHGVLESVLLNADYSSSLQAYFCPECHLVWMRALECRAYLGLDPEVLLAKAEKDAIDLKCAHCETICKCAHYQIEEGKNSYFHICPRCYACFFEAAQFALFYYLQLKTEREISGSMAVSPIDQPGLRCCDCGAEIPSFTSAQETEIGFCCTQCRQSPPILSEGKLQNVQLVTFHNMEIKIDHWMTTPRSRISITPVDPCLLDLRIFTLSAFQRICRFGHRTLKLHGQLRHHLDASESIEHFTPFHLFLKQHGTAECLSALDQMGKLDITFKPHSIIIELNAKRTGLETRLKFEALVRRFILVYERFVKQAARYVHDEAPSEEPPQPDDANLQSSETSVS